MVRLWRGGFNHLHENVRCSKGARHRGKAVAGCHRLDSRYRLKTEAPDAYDRRRGARSDGGSTACGTIAFVDRRYLGVIATNGGGSLYYASLMMKVWDDAIPELGISAWLLWKPHTLNEVMTDSVADARAIVLAAYNALVDRLGA